MVISKTPSHPPRDSLDAALDATTPSPLEASRGWGALSLVKQKIWQNQRQRPTRSHTQSSQASTEPAQSPAENPYIPFSNQLIRTNLLHTSTTTLPPDNLPSGNVTTASREVQTTENGDYIAQGSFLPFHKKKMEGHLHVKEGNLDRFKELILSLRQTAHNKPAVCPAVVNDRRRPSGQLCRLFPVHSTATASPFRLEELYGSEPERLAATRSAPRPSLWLRKPYKRTTRNRNLTKMQPLVQTRTTRVFHSRTGGSLRGPRQETQLIPPRIHTFDREPESEHPLQPYYASPHNDDEKRDRTQARAHRLLRIVRGRHLVSPANCLAFPSIPCQIPHPCT